MVFLFYTISIKTRTVRWMWVFESEEGSKLYCCAAGMRNMVSVFDPKLTSFFKRIASFFNENRGFSMRIVVFQ